MSYTDIKFCEICDEDYDWACPECPGCVARNSYYQLNSKFLAAKKVIDALPKCDKCFEKSATRHEIFEDYNSFNECHYTEHIWRCDDCGPKIFELDYAKELREYIKAIKE